MYAIRSYYDEVREAFDDDLNAPRAIASMFDFMNEANRLFVVVAQSPADAERWVSDVSQLTHLPVALYPQREALGEEDDAVVLWDSQIAELRHVLVITSYSIHYTKLYDPHRVCFRISAKLGEPA